MLFNLFGKKEKDESISRFTDLIFISQQAKQNAVVEFARQNATFLFIAWFQNTALQFRQLFAQNNLDETLIEEAIYYSYTKYLGRQIIFLERFPLKKKEEALVKNCIQKNFTVYSSLTEPLLIYFGGEKIITFMHKLGVNENEAMQHKMISQSLQKAQKKIAEKMNLEIPASSQEEWMKRNTGQSTKG